MIQKLKEPPFIIVAVLMAVVLQIQVTLFAQGDYRGLRVSLADLLLPFLGIFVLQSLLRKKSQWPEWVRTIKLFWLGSLILVMSAALLNGYIVQGSLSHWAFVNKYIGFFALLSYFLLGNWIAQNVADKSALYKVFMRYMVGFFVLILVLSALTCLVQTLVPFSLWLPRYPWDGLMANRNAFMVIFVMAFVFVIYHYKNQKGFLDSKIVYAFWLLMPMFFAYNDSRTGWIAAFILGAFFFMQDTLKRARQVIPLLLCGVVIAYGSLFVASNESNFVVQGDQFKHFVALVQKPDEVQYAGDQYRYIAVEDGLDMYTRYNPLVGAGLGSYKPFQIEKRGEFIEVIDFTALLLLVETGAIGLLVFSLFFIYCAWWLYVRGYKAEQASTYHRAMLVFLLLFAGMSVLHEIMYTRILWFAMGLALVTPRGNAHKVRACASQA